MNHNKLDILNIFIFFSFFQFQLHNNYIKIKNTFIYKFCSLILLNIKTLSKYYKNIIYFNYYNL